MGEKRTFGRAQNAELESWKEQTDRQGDKILSFPNDME